MTLPSMLASRIVWRRRAAYRKRKWEHWRNLHAQTLLTVAQRKRWWSLYRTAEQEVEALNAAIARAPKPKPSKRARAVDWASSKVGVHEEPAASNRGPQIDQWQRRLGFLAAPWCGIFCGNALLKAGVAGVTSRIASVGAIQEDAEHRRGCFSGWSSTAHGALRGDLVVLFGFGVHVELIDRVNGDGSVETTGGNTSPAPGSGSEFAGGCVARRHRDAWVIHGVAHVHYG